MKRLIIVGAGGFGREVHAWARHHPDCGRDWTIAGFLDDAPGAMAAFEGRPPVLGPIRDYRPQPGDRLVCAIGAPEVKRRVCEALLDVGARFQRLVHPSVVVGDAVGLGVGVVLCPGVVLTSDLAIGDFACLNCHSSAGHDGVVGRWATVSGHCDLMGRSRVGEGAFLGSGVRLLPGKSVGDWAHVGAGSVVLRSVRSGERVFGNPARPIC